MVYLLDSVDINNRIISFFVVLEPYLIKRKKYINIFMNLIQEMFCIEECQLD